MLGLLFDRSQTRSNRSLALPRRRRTLPWLADRIGLASLVGLVVALSILVRNLDPSIHPNLATNALVTTNGQSPPIDSAMGLLDGVLWRLGARTPSAETPWILLDLGEPKVISHVAVYNCIEDCPSDAIPLTLELGSSVQDLRAVDQKNAPFDKWVVEFPPRSCRFVRMRRHSEGSLALSEVEIR